MPRCKWPHLCTNTLQVRRLPRQKHGWPVAVSVFSPRGQTEHKSLWTTTGHCSLTAGGGVTAMSVIPHIQRPTRWKPPGRCLPPCLELPYSLGINLSAAAHIKASYYSSVGQRGASFQGQTLTWLLYEQAGCLIGRKYTSRSLSTVKTITTRASVMLP